MDLRPSSRQIELIALARALALERFAPRAERHDREASFPFDDYADLRTSGLLGLCVPAEHGGLGADYETYCLVAEQLAQAITTWHADIAVIGSRRHGALDALVLGSVARSVLHHAPSSVLVVHPVRHAEHPDPEHAGGAGSRAPVAATR